MSAVQLFLLLACVTAVSAAQILFKQLGVLIKSSASILEAQILMVGFASISLYGAATLLWIFLLMHIPLSKAYPYMALCFILVPLMAYFVFGEQLSTAYLIGCILILAGIVVIAQIG